MAICGALLALLAGCSWLPGCGCDEPPKPPPAPPPAAQPAPAQEAPPPPPAPPPGLPTAPMPPAVTQTPLEAPPGTQPPAQAALPPIAVAPSPRPSTPPPAATAQRWGAQLGAFRSLANASTSWDKFKARYIDLLNTVPGPLLREVDLGPKGKFVRVMAGPFNSESEARSLCIEVLARGGFCYVQPLR